MASERLKSIPRALAGVFHRHDAPRPKSPQQAAPPPPALSVPLPPVTPGLDDSQEQIFELPQSELDQMAAETAGNATLAFEKGANPGRDMFWQDKGVIQAGQPMTIRYDPAAAPQQSSHDGFPSWDLHAFVKFEPGGQVVHGPAIGFISSDGVPQPGAVSVPLTVDVPPDATGVQVWFKDSSLNDGDPQTFWDNNLDPAHNYHQDVAPTPNGGVVMQTPTGTGNLFTLQSKTDAAVTNSDGSYTETTHLQVTYRDTTGYFHGQQSIKVYNRLVIGNEVHGSGDVGQWNYDAPDTVLQQIAPGVYSGSLAFTGKGYVGDSQQSIVQAQFAFHDDNDHWDSDPSSPNGNYTWYTGAQ